ncbi:MAG: NrfD/PsrC family molybdoenzyme membrane anchor subunit [Gammaproteobacteria bacterium]|nr:NrfD/PsrC family molybdoenzyme membrane anchor subunit [Gammaproteobacteria bacterium]
MTLMAFFRDGLRAMFQGGKLYYAWLLTLVVLTLIGAGYYLVQLRDGLIITGMSDQVSWGFYIANFTFMVGIAAASVLLVIPSYIFHREDVKQVVIIGEALAVAAVVTAILLVVVDLARPDRFWHIIPFIGKFNLPMSMLAWDVVVLYGYLFLNLFIPFYILFKHYRGQTPSLKHYFPFVVIAIFWAISIHTVTAFLFSASSARPFWHTAITAPRFIASAFVSGPALIILSFLIIRKYWGFQVKQAVIDMLATIMMFTLYINIFFVAVEWFTDFYNESEHAASIRYLYFGLHGYDGLVPWIWTAFVFNVIAVTLLSFEKLRKNMRYLVIACLLAFTGVWIEKGMGFVIPGFIPTPIGEIFEFTPTFPEIMITIMCWAIGALTFTLLAKAAVAFESGKVKAATSK